MSLNGYHKIFQNGCFSWKKGEVQVIVVIGP